MRLMTGTRMSVAIGVAIAALRLVAPAPLELLDLRLLDLRHTARGALAAGDEVVIVGIDEASLATFGRWPWPRTRIAELLDRLGAGDAAVVGLDVVFDEPEQNIDAAALQSAIAARPDRPATDILAAMRTELDQDARFAASIRSLGRVVLGYFFELGGSATPGLATDVGRLPPLSVSMVGDGLPPSLETASRVHAPIPVLAAAAAGAGHVNFLPDPDGTFRRNPLAVRAGDRVLPAFGVEVLRRYLHGVPATVLVAPDGVLGFTVGDVDVPVDGGGRVWVNYLGPPHTFRHLSAADVLVHGAGDVVRGRMVLVGFTASGFDEISTPFSPIAPGVELQATLIDNLLHDRTLRRPWWVVPAEAATIVLFGLAVGLALRGLGTVKGVAATAVVGLGYLWATQRFFTEAHLALGAVYPLAALVFCTLGGAVFHAAVEEREKRSIRNAFRLYLNPEVTDMVASDPAHLRLGGERREVTVLFSDIQGFTGISEHMDAEVLGELLNEYLGAMTEVIFRHEGLLDKYIGDAVMAFWGAPVAQPDHARRCCHAALDMLEALSHLHGRWETQGLPLLWIRIGINSGDAAVGNFGSPRRFSYTAVGDNVNLASRLEGLNKTLGTHILISETTRQEIGDEFVCREIDQVTVRGRTQPVAVYELLGRSADDRERALRRRADSFEAAVAACRREAWDDADRQLAVLVRDWPDDRAVRALVGRVQGRRTPAPDAKAG